MAFNTAEGRAVYTASSAQTEFTFTFKVFTTADIKVYQTASGDTPNDTTDLLTLTTDYTVTINGDNGGTVTLNTGAGAGDTITLVRDLDVKRDVDYQDNGDLLASTLDSDQNYQTYLIQQAQTANARTIRLQDTTDADATLPAPSAGYIFRWNLDGDGIDAINPADVLDTTNTITVETIADLATIDTTTFKTAIVKDLTRGGKFIWSSTGTANGGTVFAGSTGYWNRQYSGAVKPRWFGAVGDGITDDTSAVQSTIDTGLNVDFEGLAYLITDQLQATTRGQGLWGDIGGFGGKSDIDTVGYGAVLIADIPSLGAGEAFVTATVPQTSWMYLKFKKATTDTCDIALTTKTLTNTDDADTYVYGCDFKGFDNGIWQYGRNLYAMDNTFISVSYPIIFDWQPTGASGGDLQTSDLYKGRAAIIKNNRFHGGSAFAITVQNYVQRGAIYEGNVVDVGQGFIKVQTNGGMDGCIINGNVSDLMSQRFISFLTTTSILDTVITNNYIGGAIAGTVDGDDKRPAYHISFDGISSFRGVTISGNSFKASDSFSIALTNDAAATPITCYDLSIYGNSFDSIGLDGVANRSILYSAFDISNIRFSNNSVFNAGATVVSMIRSASKTFTNVDSRGNLFNSSLPLFTTTTIAGTISVEHKQGGYSVETDGKFKLGDNGAYSSSVPLLLSRTSSAGGVGLRSQNSAGYIDLFSVPTGTNAGAFSPGADNTVSCGSVSLRWSTVYAGTGTINTSDILEKTFYEISEAERLCAIELKGMMRKFKFNDAIDSKGEDNARVHFGVGAQYVRDVFSKYELDPFEYALLCYDSWEDELDEKGNIIVKAGDRYGIRYEELLCFIISAM